MMYDEITTEQLVEYASGMAKWSFESGDNLMWYLNTLAKFPDYSLNNQLLIMGYKADATYIKGINEWKELGVRVKEDASPILIIEPAGGGAFQIKYMYDVSDTDYTYQEQSTDKLVALEALIAATDNIQVVDEIKSGVRAMYIPEENSIRVKRSSKVSPDVFFTSIAAESVHRNMAAETEGTYKRAGNQVTSKTVAWALGAKYNMDVSDIPLSNLPERYTGLSEKVAKKELAKIRDGFITINKDMVEKLELIKNREAARER